MDFLVSKGIFEPFFEAAQTYKRKTLEERTHTLEDGRKAIEMDIFDYIKYWGTGIGRDLNKMKKEIWNPEIGRLYSDDDGEKRLGDPYNK